MMCPDKSTRPSLKRKGNVFMSQWKRPDGKKVYALWTSKGKIYVSLSVKGNYNCYDINDSDVLFPENQVEVSPSILYFIGGGNFELDIDD